MKTGAHHSEEARAKIRAARARQVFTPEHRAALSAGKLGKPCPKRSLPGVRNPNWAGDDVGYHGIHKRLGSARNYSCVDCGQPGRQWSLKPSTPSDRLHPYEQKGITLLFSRDTTDYEARCSRCHQIADGTGIDHRPHHNAVKTHCKRGHEFTGETRLVRGRRFRICRLCRRKR